MDDDDGYYIFCCPTSILKSVLQASMVESCVVHLHPKEPSESIRQDELQSHVAPSNATKHAKPRSHPCHLANKVFRHVSPKQSWVQKCALPSQALEEVELWLKPPLLQPQFLGCLGKVAVKKIHLVSTILELLSFFFCQEVTITLRHDFVKAHKVLHQENSSFWQLLVRSFVLQARSFFQA